MTTVIQRTTLATALYDYIREREKVERSWGYTGDSAYVASLRSFVEALRTNQPVEIVGVCDE